jgi:radical SAM superfamily enzyme
MQQIPPFEHGKRYYPLSQHYLEQFGEKVYKVSVSVADSCPNREGRNGMKVCIFVMSGVPRHIISSAINRSGNKSKLTVRQSESVIGQKSF